MCVCQSRRARRPLIHQHCLVLITLSFWADPKQKAHLSPTNNRVPPLGKLNRRLCRTGALHNPPSSSRFSWGRPFFFSLSWSQSSLSPELPTFHPRCSTATTHAQDAGGGIVSNLPCWLSPEDNDGNHIQTLNENEEHLLVSLILY